MDLWKALIFILYIINICNGQDTGSKARFDEILSKFGFGKDPIRLEQQPDIAHLSKLPTDVTLDQTPKHNSKSAIQKNKKAFSNTLKKFGFGTPSTDENFATRAKASNIGQKKIGKVSSPKQPLIYFDQTENKPQFIQVVTTTISPKKKSNHIEPNKRKQKNPAKSQIRKGKKKQKKILENFPTSKKDADTVFVTPKPLNGKTKKKSKLHISAKKESLNPKESHQRPKSYVQNSTPHTTSPSSYARTRDLVNFGESSKSTQRPRHSRQQDLEDKKSALAALFNVAEGSKAKPNSSGKLEKKPKLKVTNPENLNENNILRHGLTANNRKQGPLKRVKKPTKTRKGQVGSPRKQPASRLNKKANPNDALASLFSIIKDDKQQPKQVTQRKPANKANVRTISSVRTTSRTVNPSRGRGRGSVRSRDQSTPAQAKIKSNTKKEKVFNAPQTPSVTVKKPPRFNLPPNSIKSKRPQSKHQNKRPIKPSIATTQRTFTQTSRIEQNLSKSLTPQSPSTQARVESTSQFTPSRKDKEERKKNKGSGSKAQFNKILQEFGFQGNSANNKQNSKIQIQPSGNPRRKDIPSPRSNNLIATKDKVNALGRERTIGGINVTPKSNAINPEIRIGSEKSSLPRPSTTPFTVFNSPSGQTSTPNPTTQAAITPTVANLQANTPTRVSPNSQKVLSTTRANKPVTASIKARVSPSSRSSSLGRGRARGSLPGSVSSSRSPSTTNIPRRQVSRQRNNLQNNRGLDNLLQIAGKPENNPVRSSQPVTTPSIIPTATKGISLQPPANKISIPNPFKNTQEETNTIVRGNNIDIGNTLRRNNIPSRKNVLDEKDRSRNNALGKNNFRAVGRETSESNSLREFPAPKKIQLPPRRPSVIIDDPELNSIDDDEDDDRRVSFATRHREKFEERKRPSKEKPRKEPKKLRPPVSSGCFHICDTLIFEVYKLLGGGICDC